jgi:hypothetical protein
VRVDGRRPSLTISVGMLWARAQGYWDFGPASNALLIHYPDYLLVGVAVVISHVVTTLGRQVAKAREWEVIKLGELLGRGAWARSTRPLIECRRGRPPSS